MNTIEKEKLKNAGIEADEAIERFMGNETLYLKYLLRFPGDENYQILCSSMVSGDVKRAFEAAHTLKGVCGNLSIKGMEKLLREQVEYLRAGEMEKAELMMNDLREAYEQVCVLLADFQ